jgi:hypothetical protein
MKILVSLLSSLVVVSSALAIANDDCATAQLIPVIPASLSVNTTAATTDNVGNCGHAQPAQGAWYYLIGTGDRLRVNACDMQNAGPNAVQIFTGLCNSLICVGGNDEPWPYVCDGTVATWCSILNQTYYIHIGQVSGGGVIYFQILNLGPCSTPGGNCVEEPLVAPITVTGNTCDNDDCCGLSDAFDKQYLVYLPYADQWEFKLCPPATTASQLYVGTSWCDNSICVGQENPDLNSPCYARADCPCSSLPAGYYYVTIEGGFDEPQCEPYSFTVRDCTPCISTEIIAITGFGVYNANLCANTVVSVSVCMATPVNPAEPPILDIARGMGTDLGCEDNGSEAEWLYDPQAWTIVNDPLHGECWHNEIAGVAEGSICVTFERLLPVGFLGLSAVSGNRRVDLRWSTASESDNVTFEIQRDHVQIGEVEGTNSPSGSAYWWTDRAVENGVTYHYTLFSVDVHGQREELATVDATPRANADGPDFRLYPNYPNPFNASTEIQFDVPIATTVELTVFNTVGEKVATLVNELRPAGNHHVLWDTRGMASGIYMYQLKAGNFRSSHKMVLVR